MSDRTESLPVTDTRHQFNSQQVGQSKNREVLSLSIRVNRGGLDRRLVAHKDIQDIYCFPRSAGDVLQVCSQLGL